MTGCKSSPGTSNRHNKFKNICWGGEVGLMHSVWLVLQMGHSSFGRGSPHLCYLQLGGQGLFYSRAHTQQQQQQQQQPPRWSAIAAHITTAAAGLLGGSSRGASYLASATGAAAAAVAGPSSPSEVQSVDPSSACSGESSSNSSGDEHANPPWHVMVMQGLVLAAALLVAGLLLKQFLRGVVTTLVACYSGLPFKT